MKFPKTLHKEQLLSFVSAIILFAGTTAVLAWTAPGANPPDGNAPAPINVSGNGQIKNGFLGLYGKTGGNGEYVGLAISKSDTSYLLSNTKGLSLGVRGKVGADLYCDSNGDYCVDIRTLQGNVTNINNTTVNNPTTNTTTGCVTTQQTYTANTAVTSNGGYQVPKVIANLDAGTWTVAGSGTANRTDVQGSMSVLIKVSKSGSIPNGLFLLKKGTVLTGIKPTYPASMSWEVPTTTFTITGSERVEVIAARATVGGSITITGPKTVCN